MSPTFSKPGESERPWFTFAAGIDWAGILLFLQPPESLLLSVVVVLVAVVFAVVAAAAPAVAVAALVLVLLMLVATIPISL